MYSGEQAQLYQASAILDSSSKEAWEETKKRPRGGRWVFVNHHGGESTLSRYIREHTENAYASGQSELQWQV